MYRLFLIYSLLSLIVLLDQGQAVAGICEASLQAEEKCRVRVKDLRPAQFTVGGVDVEAKRAELQLDKKERIEYLKENRPKIVISPEGEYYLIDGHHRALAAYEEGIEEVYVDVVKNFSGATLKEFEEAMTKEKWVRLVDENGTKRKFSELPRKLKQLVDDPYRSLAWVVRKSKAFKNDAIPFAEFEWADFFRTRIAIGKGKKDWDNAVEEAIALAMTDETKGLPGKKIIPPDLRADMQSACARRFAEFGFSIPK